MKCPEGHKGILHHQNSDEEDVYRCPICKMLFKELFYGMSDDGEPLMYIDWVKEY